MDNYEKIFGNKQTIMVVMAHPDDLDAYCGGTVARLIADGKKVISLKLTAGDNGTRDNDIAPQELAQQRLHEDEQAMHKLGLAPDLSVNLHIKDGAVENSLETIEKIVYQMRKFQPDLIITTNPEDAVIRRKAGKYWVNHRDHRNTALCALDAAYPYSRDKAFFAEQFADPDIQPCKCSDFLIADVWDGEDCALIQVDDYIDTKIAALSCHESQFTPESAKTTVELFTTHAETPGYYEKFRYITTDAS